MKLFQLNFFSIILLIILLGLFVLLPSYVIENIWNATFSRNIEQDLSIEIWQAALLWGAIVSLVYMSGIFSFKIDFKTIDSIDLDSISDPELRDELLKLKQQAQQNEDQKKNPDDQDNSSDI